MAGFKISSFSGIAPRTAARLLAANQAQKAVDCDLQNGNLKARPGLANVFTPPAGPIATIYRFGIANTDPTKWWFTNQHVACYAKTQINGDTSELTAWSGDPDGPKITDFADALSGYITQPEPAGSVTGPTTDVPAGTSLPIVAWALGVPRPTGTISVAVNVVQKSVTSIALSGTTATAYCPAHGFADQATVTIAGATPNDYNGDYTIHLVDADHFSYTVDTSSLAAASGTITATLSGTYKEERSYAVTYVSPIGAQTQEGAPGTASDPVAVIPGETVTLSNLPTGPTGAYNIQTKRIYRSASTAQGQTALQFCAEIPVTQTTWTDDLSTAQLGSQMICDTWDPPPSTLKGLKNFINGMMVGFSGYDLYVTEAYQPHAWPRNYMLSFPYPIVGVGIFGTTMIVLTTGFPYMVTGSSPGSLTQQRIDSRQACVSMLSIVEAEGGVYYASPNGLILVNSAGCINVSQDYMRREDWQALNPASLKGFFWDSRYVGFWKSADGTTKAGFVYDPLNKTWTTLDYFADAGYSDIVLDKLYLLVAGVIYEFNGGPLSNYDWKSKKFHVPFLASMAAGRIRALAYPVTFYLWADGKQVCALNIADNRPFSIPLPQDTEALANDFEVELIGNVEVEEVAIAESFDEILET